jgi:hypothetical protein
MRRIRYAEQKRQFERVDLPLSRQEPGRIEKPISEVIDNPRGGVVMALGDPADKVPVVNAQFAVFDEEDLIAVRRHEWVQCKVASLVGV